MVVADPRVTRLLEVGHAEDGSGWFLREYVAGATLRQGLSSLTQDERWAVFTAVAQALQSLHHEGLFHGDLRDSG